MKKRVLIVGAGIAGLTLAAFLRKNQDFQVEIVEKSKTWNSLGYTLGIWDNGRQILKRLNLEKEFDKHGDRIKEYHLSNHLGQTIKLYHFKDFYKKFESAYTHIKRKELHDILIKSVNTKIKMDTTIRSIKEIKEGIKVNFSDRSHRVYDLLVGADGINSKVRDKFFGRNFTHPTGFRAWFCWIDKRKLSLPKEVLEIVGPGGLVHIFDEKGDNLCLVLVAKETPGKFDNPKDRIKRIAQHFNEFNYVLPKILNSINSVDLTPTDIKFVKMGSWVKGKVVLIGDSAHAMEPFAGIGASMAMEDSYVLYEELSKSPRNIQQALERYEERRRPRIELALDQTREMWWWNHFQIRLFCKLRDSIASLMPIRHFTKGFKKLLKERP